VSKNNLRLVTVASALSVIGFSFPNTSFAQAIAPDQTLLTNTQVNFNSANKTYAITGGTQVGTNQFHSFQDFSVPTGNTAHFDNALTTNNVIGRVTGSNVSNIDGRITNNGTANLYLINPNGIVFGNNAKLDVAGSFSASTANSVKFSDGSEFSATNPQAPPLLQINVPLGLQYGKSNSGATISNSGNLAAGQDLVLNANKLDLQGSLQAGRDLTLQSQDSVKIRDTVDNPFVANSGRELTIQGNNSVDIFALNNPLTQIFSGRHLSLVSDGVIAGDAHFLSGGNLAFLTTTGEVANFASNYAAIIYANGDVAFGDYTGAALKVDATGSIQTGGIRITSPDTSGAIPTNDPDFVTLTTLPSVILRAGVTSVAANMPQVTGNITFGSLDTSSVTGDGGAIELTANGDIKANYGYLNSSSNLESGSLGNGGAISLSTIVGDISLPNSFLNTSSTSLSGSSGNGGAISLSTINGDISLPDSILSTISISFSDSGNSGNGGTISLSTINGDISLPNSILTAVSSTTYNSYSGNSGNGGAISLSTITGDISLPNSKLFSNSFSYTAFSGNSGNGGAISLSTNTGDISLPNSLLYSYSLSDSFSLSGSNNSGNGGAISLSTNTGDILLPNSSLFSLSSSFSDLGSGNSGNGGAISLSAITGNISLKSLELNSDSGNSGNGEENPSILNSYSYSDSGNSGNGGDIILSAVKGNILGAGSPSTSIYSFSVANTPNSTSGAGGNVNLDAKNLINNFEFVTASSSGIAGNAKINGFGDLTISGLQVSTSKTVSIRDIRGSDEPIILDLGTSGSSGDVTVTGLGSLTFDNTIINSVTQSSNPAGNISITSPSTVTFQNNSQILSSTNNSGLAGSVTIKANQDIIFKDNSKILAQTNGSGKAGNINVIAGNSILFSGAGTGLFADTTANSIGNGGNIFIDPQLVLLRDGAKIAVGSFGKGNGGNITIISNLLTLLNGSSITAETASTDGGNINLNIPSLLLMRYASQISTTAGTDLAGGNGGNIDIKSGFVVGIKGENSDIFANAFTGNGGNINITTNGIYGLEFRPQLTPFSDIVASSQFGVQGNVSINTPGVDPSEGLNNLPADTRDASRLLANACIADRRGSSFTITGKGGIAAKPSDRPSSTNALDNLGTISTQTANLTTSPNVSTPTGDRIVEATGWIRNAKNQIILIAGEPPAQTKVRCP